MATTVPRMVAFPLMTLKVTGRPEDADAFAVSSIGATPKVTEAGGWKVSVCAYPLTVSMTNPTLLTTLESPEYLARIGIVALFRELKLVISEADPAGLSVIGLDMQVLLHPLQLKTTLPVGAPLPPFGCTEAVKVTSSPR